MEFLRHLKALQQRVIAQAEPYLRERGLSGATVHVLGLLERYPYPSELVRELGLSAPTVSRLVRELEGNGYVVRETETEDLRRHRLHLTPAGQRARTEGRQRMEAAVEDLLARLTMEQRDELDRLLGTIARWEDDHGGQ